MLPWQPEFLKESNSFKKFWRGVWQEHFHEILSKSDKLFQRRRCLTHYQTTNFRLFQTERVCRRQIEIWRKWQKVIQTGRKHCGKRRNCSLWAISPFPTVFSKGLFPRGVKGRHCVGRVKEKVTTQTDNGPWHKLAGLQPVELKTRFKGKTPIMDNRHMHI